MASHISTGAERAVKKIPMKALEEAGGMKGFEAEVGILRHMDHPNIVKLYETFKDAKYAFVVMEVCSGGELLDRVVEESRKVSFSERQAATYCEQMLAAVYHIHMKGFAHRDIKPENCLLSDTTPKAEVKIIDFGQAAKSDRNKPFSSKCCLAYYTA